MSGRTLTFTYDAIGNPTKYYTGSIDRQGNAEVYSLTWEQGRQLSDITADDGQVRIRISYDYDADGIRTEKRVEYTTHSYVTQNGKVVRETISGDGTEEVLDFVYDESGRPFALNYSTNGGSSFTTYYYILNLQGDVVKLVNSSGTEYASYTYDAWGRILSTSGSLAYTNPLRYRGYYYDDETDFYYLQSRYYDPEMRRFINVDNIVSTGQGMLGCNMFAYCRNRPVVSIDPTGNMAVYNKWLSLSRDYTPLCPTSVTSRAAYDEFRAKYKEITGMDYVEINGDVNYFNEMGANAVKYSATVDYNYVHEKDNPTASDLGVLALVGIINHGASFLSPYSVFLSGLGAAVGGGYEVYYFLETARKVWYPDEVASGVVSTKYDISYSWDTPYGGETFNDTYVISISLTVDGVTHYSIYKMYPGEERGYCIYP